MKITIEQAMATHQEGQFKEAEQLYNEKQNKISKIIKNIKEIN